MNDTRLLRAVLDELTAVDPYDLRPGTPEGAPVDEYGLEAKPIATLLQLHGRVTPEDLDRVWNHWFSEPLSVRIGERDTAALAARLTKAAD